MINVRTGITMQKIIKRGLDLHVDRLSLTWMGHCYGVVGTVGAHIVYENSRGVEVCSVTDLVSVCTIPRSHQRHPGGVGRDRGEPDSWVARLSVLQEGRHQDQSSGFLLGRVLTIPTALGFLCPDLRGNGV